MNKKEFNALVSEIGLDAAIKKLKGNKKNFYISLKDDDKPVVKGLQYKKGKKSKKLKKNKYTNFKELTEDMNEMGLSHKTKLKKMGNFLNANCPKSEKWFRELYMAHFYSKMDEFNKPFKSKYIPDVLNIVFNYVIEIDGSLHETPEQKEKDRIKDEFYKSHGYTVIRIQAYNNNSYIEAIKLLFVLRHKKRMPNPDFFQFVKQNSIDIMSLGML